MITPMVARLVSDPFDREGWLFELKWDGFRAIAEKDKLGVRLYSRNQKGYLRQGGKPRSAMGVISSMPTRCSPSLV
jgi:ATP-dependent DNA ligase